MSSSARASYRPEVSAIPLINSGFTGYRAADMGRRAAFQWSSAPWVAPSAVSGFGAVRAHTPTRRRRVSACHSKSGVSAREWSGRRVGPPQLLSHRLHPPGARPRDTSRIPGIRKPAARRHRTRRGERERGACRPHSRSGVYASRSLPIRQRPHGTPCRSRTSRGTVWLLSPWSGYRLCQSW